MTAFDAPAIRALLADLDAELRDRGITADV
jgi:hypothetical protein